MSQDAKTSGLSDFEKVQRANYANCLKKVKAGKTLTSAELKVVEEASAKAGQPSSDWVKTKIVLARRVRMTRANLDRYLAMEGAPKPTEDRGYNVDEVKRFILQRAKKTFVAGKMDDAVEDLRKWEIFERARRIHLRNEKDTNAIMQRSHHNSIISGMVAELHRHFSSLGQRLAPEVVGLTVPDAEKRINLAVSQGWEVLRETREKLE